MKQCPSCGRKNYNGEKYCPVCKYYLGNIKEESNVTTYNKPKQTTTVECPYCKSYNVKRISAASRLVSTTLFGLASKKLGKQFHCNDCDSDF